MRRSTFFFLLTVLVIVNGYLLSQPNMLGKIGLIVYRYYYLRTFPRTLLTVSMVVSIAVLISETINWLADHEKISRRVATGLFSLMIVLSFVQLIKTGVDFTAWSYAHSGFRFRIGAFMLPTVVIFVFTYGWMNIPGPSIVEQKRWMAPQKESPTDENSQLSVPPRDVQEKIRKGSDNNVTQD